MSRMSLDTAIRLSAEVRGGGNIDRVKKSLQDLAQASQVSARDMATLRSATFQFARANANTVAGIRNSIAAFRGLQEQAQIGSREFRRYSAEIQQLEQRLQGLDGPARQAGDSLGKQLAAGLAAGLATIGTGQIVGASLNAVIASEESERRLRSLSQGLDEYNKVQATATAAAQRFGVAQTQTNQEFAQIYARLRPIGLTLQEISTVYNGFNTAAKLSGANSAEASAAFLQLSQALGTGVLRGEELNSVFEQTPTVVQAIAQVMGVPIGKIRELAEQGKITGGIVLQALRQIERDGAPKLAEAMKGPAQQFRNLQIAGNELQIELGEALLPTAITLANGITSLVKVFNALPEPVKIAAFVTAGLTAAIIALQSALAVIGGIQAITTALAAYRTITIAATAAQIGLNLAVLANPWVALAAGITAATVALATWQTQSQKTGAAARTGEPAGMAEARKRLTNTGREISLLERQRETSRGPERASIDRRLNKLQAEQRQLQADIAAGERARATPSAAGITSGSDSQASGMNTIAGIQNRLKELKDLRDQAQIGTREFSKYNTEIKKLEDKISGLVGSKSNFKPSSRARALMAAADKLGVSPLDLATIISFETGGTFSPSKMGGAGGNYMGLIQFGPNERKAYGARPDQSFEEQVTGPVVRYFQDRFKGVGMSTQGANLEDLYTTVLAGNPKANRNARDSFGTSARSGVARMGPHRQKALQTFFGGSMANVELDPLKQAESANEAYEQIQQQQKAAADLLNTERNRLTILETADPLQRQVVEAMVKQSDIQTEYGRKLNESKSAQETLSLQMAQQNALRSNALDLERALSQEIDNVTQPLQSMLDASRQKLELETRYDKLLKEGVNPELALEYAQLELAAEKQAEILTLRMAELEAAKAKLNAESDVAKALQSQIDKIKEILKLQGKQVDKSKDETAEERKARTDRERREKDAKEAAERAKNLYRGIVNTIEDGIVGSIQAGIDSLIDGTKKLDQALKEIAAGVLKEISNQLLRFAINAGMRAIFPGAFADGGVFQAGGLQKFAAGGTFSNSIVSSPTLFKFADGGTMRSGIMGEAGPEAIMPLRRGPNGRLGVDASGLAVPFQRPAATAAGAELEVPFQRTAAGLEVPFLKDRSTTEPAGAATMIDVRFETVRIGDLDVVTRDEAQRIGRESAQRGAELAHKRYRNSPTARRAAGIS